MPTGLTGDWSIFRPLDAFANPPLAENMDLSPSVAPETELPMPTAQESQDLIVFPSSLGWMAILTSGETLTGLTFAHRGAGAAANSLAPLLTPITEPDARWQDLVERLQAYAAGENVNFRDVRIDTSRSTDFQRRVLELCRKIPRGETLTYGQLAARAGRPAAARAVGNCMATNRIPLVIPCHRVVAASGRLGGFSAPGGVDLKRRLLELEAGSQAFVETRSE